MKLFDHYIPRTDGKLSVWAHTYKQKIGELGASLGLTPEQIPEQQKIAQALIDNIADVAIKRNSFREATSAKKLFQEIHLKEIRRMVRFMKTFGNYSPNMGAELRVVITG